jgi:hypothetical protein
MILANPEAKVVAGVAGTTFGGTLSGFIVWVLGITVWGASNKAVSQSLAVADVPIVVVLLVTVVITGFCTYVAAWLAPHTVTSADSVSTPLEAVLTGTTHVLPAIVAPGETIPVNAPPVT